MGKKFQICITVLFLACFMSAVISVAAAQSMEQSISGSLTRGSRFTVTITGLPNTPYYIWLTGTFTMTGKPYDQPPVIADNTMNVVKDPPGGPYTIGSYQYNNGGGRTILDDVAASTPDMPNTNYYAQVTTDETGVALVEFQTSAYTAIRSYSVKVENPQSPESTNMQVEQTVFSRAARPMIITPTETIETTTPAPHPLRLLSFPLKPCQQHYHPRLPQLCRPRNPRLTQGSSPLPRVSAWWYWEGSESLREQ